MVVVVVWHAVVISSSPPTLPTVLLLLEGFFGVVNPSWRLTSAVVEKDALAQPFTLVVAVVAVGVLGSLTADNMAVAAQNN